MEDKRIIFIQRIMHVLIQVIALQKNFQAQGMFL